MSSKYFDEQKCIKNKNKSFVILTTYAMVSKKRDPKGSNKKTAILEEMKNIEWGLCLLDEV